MAPPIPSIAIVAVHGVGNHKPGASAEAMADLLLRLHDDDGASRFDAFEEHRIRIPTRPAIVHPPEEVHEPTGRGSIFTEQSDELRASIEHRQGDGLEIEHSFMREQLSEFRSTGEPYETIRLAGRRRPRTGARASDPAACVDIYEMHWADLSRLRSGALAIFGELYQMLFHVAHLGRLAIDHASVEFNDVPGWRLHAVAHRWAVRLLTAFVPVFWLTMLVTVLGVVALQLPASAKPWIVTVSGAAVAVALVWRQVYRLAAARRGVGVWLAIPIAGAIAARVLWLYAQAESTPALHLDRAVLLTWMLLGSFLTLGVCARYERMRPGVFLTGVACVALAFGATLGFAVPAANRALMLNRTVNIFEVETVGTVALWYVLYGFGISAVVGGWWARRHLAGSALLRARRVAWTSCATISLSASSVLVMTFVLWAGIYSASRGLLPQESGTWLFGFFGDGATTYDAFFGNVLRTTAGAGFPLLLIVMSALAAAVVLAFLPAVVREVWPGGTGDAFDLRASRADLATANADADATWKQLRLDAIKSARLGEWLTSGFKGLMVAVTLLFVTTFIIQPGATIIHWIVGARVPFLESLQQEAQAIILVLGGWLAAAAVGLLALRDRLESLALGFRPMLDAALDVDNYLRQHPRTRTPRARIAERYASLLRYLARWRDANGAPYSAIVLVAHSQGTVITADMLGFLQRERDPEIDPLLPTAHDGASRTGLYLFTMGSPLRQLYASSFPHLFAWVNEEPRSWGGASTVTTMDHDERAPADLVRDEPHVVVPPVIPSMSQPDPRDLGVVRWVNAYRSGDYVGRALWRTAMMDCSYLYSYAASDARAMFPGARPPVTYISEDAARSRRELCLGRGAHTHYWDDTAKAVAIELDALVREAAATAAPRAAEQDVLRIAFTPAPAGLADRRVIERPEPTPSGQITLDPPVTGDQITDAGNTSPGAPPS